MKKGERMITDILAKNSRGELFYCDYSIDKKRFILKKGRGITLMSVDSFHDKFEIVY